MRFVSWGTGFLAHPGKLRSGEVFIRFSLSCETSCWSTIAWPNCASSAVCPACTTELWTLRRRPVCTAVPGSSSIPTTASWPLMCNSCPPLSSAASRTTRLPRPCQVLQSSPETRQQAASHPLAQERRCLDGRLCEPWSWRNLYRDWAWKLDIIAPFLGANKPSFYSGLFFWAGTFLFIYWYWPVFCHLVSIYRTQPWQLRNCLS